MEFRDFSPFPPTRYSMTYKMQEGKEKTGWLGNSSPREQFNSELLGLRLAS